MAQVPRLEPDAARAAELYLTLLKGTLTRTAFPEPYRSLLPTSPTRRRLVAAVQAVLGRAGVEVVRRGTYDPAKREVGRDWPAEAETMIGMKRLDNLEHCITTALADGVPGDLIETGVWRGGATIFMRAVLEVYGVRDRTVWVADSFAGLPAPDPARYPADARLDLSAIGRLAIGVETVRANFARYGLLDDQVQFLPGWFKDTLPSAPIERLAVMRLDGDLYESTIDALESLYPKLSVGGFVIVDDYLVIEACRRAVHDYRKRHGIDDEIVPVDGDAVFWRRSA